MEDEAANAHIWGGGMYYVYGCFEIGDLFSLQKLGLVSFAKLGKREGGNKSANAGVLALVNT